MAPLMERVTTLLRANVNDLIDKAENPEKLIKQLLLDMENQLMQVKTQVAIAIADQHLLEQKKKEQEDAAANWQRKAELAVNKGDDALACAALDRSLSHQQNADGFAQQIEDQRAEAETLRINYSKLQQKLQDTAARCDLLLAQHRRSSATGKANKAQSAATGPDLVRSIDRMRGKIMRENAVNTAYREVEEEFSAEKLEDRFRKLEREDKIQQLLEDLKSRRAKSA